MQVNADASRLAALRLFARDHALELGASEEEAYDLMLAVDEAASNIIRHGYRGGAGVIQVQVWREGHSLLVQVKDRATPFDPTRAPAADLSLPLESRVHGGLGIHLIRHLIDEITYRPRPGGGNELTLIKRLGSFLPDRRETNNEDNG